jgi:DNA-binding IclR family transcriptional regulator
MSGRYEAPSVRKAFTILHTIADHPREFGISSLAKRLGMNKSSVHGIAAALEDAGAIQRDRDTKTYELGNSILELGEREFSSVRLRETARKHIEWLRDVIGETVFLCTLRGERIVVLDVVDSAKEMKITTPPGTTFSLTAGAIGKVFLAWMNEGRALGHLSQKGVIGFTERTITNLQDYFRALDEVRARGFALDDEEYLTGVRAVAAPVTTTGPLVACICLLGFTSSLNGGRMQQAITHTLKAARAIARELAEKE